MPPTALAQQQAIPKGIARYSLPQKASIPVAAQHVTKHQTQWWAVPTLPGQPIAPVVGGAHPNWNPKET